MRFKGARMRFLGKINANKIRGFGSGGLIVSISLAALNLHWETGVLAALFVIGLGIGLGDWKGGE